MKLNEDVNIFLFKTFFVNLLHILQFNLYTLFMQKRILSTLFIGFLSIFLVNAQSFEQTLNRYNNVSTRLADIQKIDDFLSTGEEIDNLLTETKSIIRTFQALNGIKDDYRLASGYYSVLSYLKLAQIYDAGLDFDNAFIALKNVTPYVNGTVNIPLPIYYKMGGYQYQITAENMLALKNEYYTLMQELTYTKGKDDEFRQALTSQIQLNTAHYSIITGLSKLFDLEKNKYQTFTGEDKVFFYSSFLLFYSKLNSSQITEYSKSKHYMAWYSVATDLLAASKSIPVSNNSTANIAKALIAMSESGKHSETLIDLFQYSFTNFYQTSDYQGNTFAFNTNIDPYSYYLSAEKMANAAKSDAKTNDSYLNTAMNILSAAEKEKATKLALAALPRMGDYAVSKNQCERIQETAEKLNKWGFAAEYAKYNALVLPCQVAVKKEADRKARELKRANSKTNIYLGAYPLGLFTKADKMDLGAALNFVTAGKGALELSFLKIQQKRDNYFDIWMMEKKYNAEDLSLWDGYYAHVQYKFFNNRSNPGLYNGVLLGYADKNFDPFTVKTTNIQTFVEKDELFDPTLRQGIFMLNEGYMGLYKGIGFDVFMGVGATYNLYNSGNTTYDSSTHSMENNVLLYRKSQYFSFIMRFGITIGLNIGNGNRK